MTCGEQHYKSKSYRRTFTDLSKSVLSSSNLPLEDWLEYAKWMILGFSIRRAAIQIGVCNGTYPCQVDNNKKSMITQLN